MAADTTDTGDDQGIAIAGLSPETQAASSEAEAGFDPETKRRMQETALSPSGDSALTYKAQPSAEPSPVPAPTPTEKPSPSVSNDIYGRQTIFHYNYNLSRDKEDPGSQGFFGVNLDDPNLQGAAVPVDILEAQFGKFTVELPDGTYAPLNTPEAKEVISQIKRAHVLVTGPNGTQKEFPIVDIQGSYKHWHRVIDLTYGATRALGLKDDTYLSYQVVSGDGVPYSAQASWSDNSPIGDFYRKNGKRLAGLSPSKVIAAAKAKIAPDMSDKEFDDTMRSDDGKERLKAYQSKPKELNQSLRELPAYKGLSDDDLTKKVYSDLARAGKLDPSKTDLRAFRDTIFPNPGAFESVMQVFNEDSSFWEGARRSGSAMAHQMSAQLYDLPANIGELDKKLFGGIPMANQVRDFVDKHSPMGDYYRQLVNYFHGLSQAQAKQAEIDQQRAAEIKTTPGAVGKVVGGTVSSMTLQSPLLLSGMPIKNIAAIAGAYEAVSKAGEAAQKNQDTWLLQGIEAGGMDYMSMWMANAPTGRLQTGFNMMLAGTGPETVSKWLTGQPIDWTQTFTSMAISATTGMLIARGAEEPNKAVEDVLSRTKREVTSAEVLGPEPVPEKGLPKDVMVTRIDPGVWTPSSLLSATGQLPSGSPQELSRGAAVMESPPAKTRHVFMPELIQAELREAAKEKENGDTQKSVQHMNRVLAAHNGDEQKEIVQGVIDFSKKLADTSPNQKPLTETDKIMVRHVFGMGEVDLIEGKEHPESTKYYSGIDLGIITSWLRSGFSAAYESEASRQIRTQVAPQTLSRSAGVGADIARKWTSKAEYEKSAIPTEIAHAMRVDNVLRGGEKERVRTAHFTQYGQKRLEKMLIDHEAKKPTGYPVADELIKFHDTVYHAINEAEKLARFTYTPVEEIPYIFRAIKKNQREAYKKYYNARVSTDPSFVHQREFRLLKDALDHGFKLSTYNPERLMQMRLGMSMDMIKKVMTLSEGEQAGVAYKADKPGLGQGIKDTFGQPWRAPNGEWYYVHPDFQAVLNRSWDNSSIYDWPLVFSVPLKALALAKGVGVGLKLMGLAHPKHILAMGAANALTRMSWEVLQHGTKADPKVFTKELERFFTFGHASSRVVQVAQGNKPESELTPDEIVDLDHFHRAGLNASMNEERRIQFGEMLQQWAPKASDWVAGKIPPKDYERWRMGYEIFQNVVLQKYIFGTLIPQMKFEAFKSMRDELVHNLPELLKPESKIAFNHELGKIGEQIETRFGEQFYKNLLWPKMMKEVGTTAFLSMGWTLSALRIYRNTIIDMGKLGLNVLEGKFKKGDLTEQLLFNFWYTVISAAQGAIITELFNKGKDAALTWFDLLYPRIGKDPEGRDKRVSPVEFTREAAQLNEHVNNAGGWPMGIASGGAAMLQNKLAPMISDIAQEFQNKNFYGQRIADTNDAWNVQLEDHLKSILIANFSPIFAQGFLQPTGRPYTLTDATLSVMGFPQAPMWTGRTAMENRIMNTARELDSKLKTPENMKRAEQYEKLRTAVIEKNDAERDKAREELKKLNVPQGTISKIEHNPTENYVHVTWKKLPVDEQRKILKLMSPEERKEYLPLANKALRNE